MKVSIIMGAYNTASTLPASIDSVINQTFKDWELIICDDCSMDNTYEVAKSYADKYDNIVVIRNEKNSRLAYSLNHCLKYAKGEYIARMDADDLCFADRLEKQVKFLDSNPQYEVVGGGVVLFNEKGNEKLLLNPEAPTVKDLIKTVPFFHPTIMMRKSAYDSIGGYTVSERTKRGQDYDMWFRFYRAGFRGYNLQEPVLKYHDDEQDYKKKSSLSVAIGLAKTRWYGYRLNKMPIYSYFYVLKPILSAIVPAKIGYFLHKAKN